MKYINIFLSLALLISGCQKQEEEAIIDLDQMVRINDEFDSADLAGEPLQTPQEILIKEPTSLE